MTMMRFIRPKLALNLKTAAREWIGFGGWVAVWLMVASALPAAEPVKMDSLKVGGRTYRKLIVLGVSETDLYFRYDHGIANVKLKYLEPELQKRFDYDPKAAEEAERRQVQEDAAYHETVAIELTERAQKAMRAAAEAVASTEDSLSDPVSNQSLLNRPAPKLDLGKWLGETPATEGKAVLVFFWTTWSVPCRKAIPEMNSFHKKFHDKLVVVGLSAQDEKDVAGVGDVKIDFPVAVDPKGKLAVAAGVTCVPQVLLIDAKGVVRYVGHPAALDASILKKLLAKRDE